MQCQVLPRTAAPNTQQGMERLCPTLAEPGARRRKVQESPRTLQPQLAAAQKGKPVRQKNAADQRLPPEPKRLHPLVHFQQTGSHVQWLQMRVMRAPERARRVLLTLQVAVHQRLGRAAETRRMKGTKTG